MSMEDQEAVSFLAWEDPGYDSAFDVRPATRLKGGHVETNGNMIGRGWAMVHMLKAFIGTAILAMPFSFKLVGFTFGMLLLMLISLAIFWAMLLLIEAKRNVEKMIRETDENFEPAEEEQKEGSSVARVAVPLWRQKILNELRTSGTQLIYTDLGRVIYGKLGALMVNICMVSLQLGIVVVYIIFIGKNLSNVMCKFSDSEFCWGTTSLDLQRPTHAKIYSAEPFHVMVCVATVSAIPLFLLRNLKTLRFASLFAMATTCYAVIYVIYTQATLLYYEEIHHDV